MKPPSKKVTMICNNTGEPLQNLLSIANILVSAGHEVRFLSRVEHQILVVEDKTESSSIDFVPVFRQCFQQYDFMTLMKYMSSHPELQLLIRQDSRLQVAMAKCDSTQFTSIMKGVKLCKEQSKMILEDLKLYSPDLILTDNETEYFACYAKHVLKIPSATLLLNSMPRKFMTEEHFVDDWNNFETAMALQEEPRLIERLELDCFSISSIKNVISKVPSFTFDHEIFAQEGAQRVEYVVSIESQLTKLVKVGSLEQ